MKLEADNDITFYSSTHLILRLTKIRPEHVLGWEINLRVFYVDISARRPWSPL